MKRDDVEPTWEPFTFSGRIDWETRDTLPDTVFAFPQHRKAPLTDARHVRGALARFDQVTGVTDEDRDLAFENIKRAAEYYGVALKSDTWRNYGKDAG